MSFQQRLTNEYVTLLTIYMCITIYICMRCWDGRGSVDGPITLEKLEMKKVPPKKGPPCLRGPFPLILGPAEVAAPRADSFFFAREPSTSGRISGGPKKSGKGPRRQGGPFLGGTFY